MKNIVVDFEAKVITVTSNFAKRAGVAGTPEYHTLVGVMRDFPDYAIRVKSVPSRYTPSPYSRLTYADMEEYIKQNVAESQHHQKLLELRYNKELLGFTRAKALFIQEYMKPDEHDRKETVA